MADQQNESKDMYATVQMAPWFMTLAQEFAQAGKRALQQGVRPDHVYRSIKAGLNEVLRESLRVNVEADQQG